VCGGFPCQDISVAGNKKGIQNGTRSGLWFEYKRIIEATQPKYVIIENVRELLNNGLTRVLQDIHHLGYDAEWSVIASTSAGLPNKRERVWIVAYPRCFRRNVVENTSKGRDIFCYVYRNAAEKEKELKGKLELWARSDAAIHGELSTSFWETQFGVCGVVDGLPKELSILEDKALKAYGNSVCPEIPYLIGKRIMEIESA
jgi:DNA (cytosine-5)-methyltransferase 1